MAEKRFSFYFPFVLPSLVALGSLIYYLFYISGKPLCNTQGCVLAGSFLKVKEWVLYLVFTLFCWLFLFGVIVYYRKKSEFWKNFLLILIFSSLAFDGAILGYQIWIMKTICWSCLGVSTAVFILLFSIVFLRISILNIIIGILIWILPFFAHAILKTKIITVSLDNTVLYTQKGTSPKPFRIYIFFSLNCSHCKHLLYDLSKQDSYNVDFNLCCLSRDKKSLRILTAFVEDPLKLDSNPFKRILKYIEKSDGLNRVNKLVKQKVEMADLFFRLRMFKGVPLMIIKGSDVELTLIGRNRILSYLVSNKILDLNNLKAHD